MTHQPTTRTTPAADVDPAPTRLHSYVSPHESYWTSTSRYAVVVPREITPELQHDVERAVRSAARDGDVLAAQRLQVLAMALDAVQPGTVDADPALQHVLWYAYHVALKNWTDHVGETWPVVADMLDRALNYELDKPGAAGLDARDELVRRLRHRANRMSRMVRGFDPDQVRMQRERRRAKRPRTPDDDPT